MNETSVSPALLFRVATHRERDPDCYVRLISLDLKLHRSGPSGSARIDQARANHAAQARTMLVEGQNRVHSISLFHENLYWAGDLARIDFCDYLLSLTKGLTDGWKGTDGSVDIVVEALGVQLGVDTAIPCGLIVTELVTKALKHAFPNAASGSIRVTAMTEPEGWLKLTVQDDGVGLSEDLDLHRSGSLGLKLVDSLIRQLNAKIEIGRDGGTSFGIHFQRPSNGDIR